MHIKPKKARRTLNALATSFRKCYFKIIVTVVTCGITYISGGKAMADKIGEFLTKYGIFGSSIIILVIILTALVKWPIKNAAVKWAVKKGLGEEGKKKITQWMGLVPFIFSFVLSFIYVLWQQCAWDVNVIDWMNVSKFGVAYGAAAIAAFDVVKGFVQAYAVTTNNQVVVSEPTDEVKAEEHAEKPAKEDKALAKKEAKAKKLAEKEEAKKVAEEEKKVKKLNSIEEQIAALQAEKEALAVNQPIKVESVVEPLPQPSVDEDDPDNR